MAELRRLPIHRSLNRPNLLFGAERELILITGLIAFTLIFVSMSFPVIILGFMIWLIVAGLLRLMAKADPMMSRIYMRHVKYKTYYPPHSRPFRES